jgi:RimJ/RimL family protein N-acetyltransferase
MPITEISLSQGLEDALSPVGVLESLFQLWNNFQPVSIEATQFHNMNNNEDVDVFTFAEKCCIYFALIMTREIQDQQKDGDDQVCEKDPIPIGFVYYTPSHGTRGEVNLGIALSEGSQRKGYAFSAMQLALAWAFDNYGMHRVQAAVIDHGDKDRSIGLLTRW